MYVICCEGPRETNISDSKTKFNNRLTPFQCTANKQRRLG